MSLATSVIVLRRRRTVMRPHSFAVVSEFGRMVSHDGRVVISVRKHASVDRYIRLVLKPFLLEIISQPDAASIEHRFCTLELRFVGCCNIPALAGRRRRVWPRGRPRSSLDFSINEPYNVDDLCLRKPPTLALKGNCAPVVRQGSCVNLAVSGVVLRWSLAEIRPQDLAVVGELGRVVHCRTPIAILALATSILPPLLIVVIAQSHKLRIER
mmetsp:Transcript_41879/g.115432  ORF Transcript_41879/g.115432 Transcript_41879/m.115432 type:complete len:212 (+) Transcript_41879:321-956(+)